MKDCPNGHIRLHFSLNNSNNPMPFVKQSLPSSDENLVYERPEVLNKQYPIGWFKLKYSIIILLLFTVAYIIAIDGSIVVSYLI